MDLTWDDEFPYKHLATFTAVAHTVPRRVGRMWTRIPRRPLSFDYHKTGGPSGIAAARIVNRDAKFWKHTGDQSLDVPDGLRRVIERAFNSARSTATGFRLGWVVQLT